MKVGDLIRFRLNYGAKMNGQWSPPALVINRLPPPDEDLWIARVWNRNAIVEEKNYEIELLSAAKCQENVNND